MSKSKPKVKDEFKEKYDKPGNIAINVKGVFSAEHPLFKGRPIPAEVILQLVIMPDGTLAGRIVG